MIGSIYRRPGSVSIGRVFTVLYERYLDVKNCESTGSIYSQNPAVVVVYPPTIGGRRGMGRFVTRKRNIFDYFCWQVGIVRAEKEIGF